MLLKENTPMLISECCTTESRNMSDLMLESSGSHYFTLHFVAISKNTGCVAYSRVQDILENTVTLYFSPNITTVNKSRCKTGNWS